MTYKNYLSKLQSAVGAYWKNNIKGDGGTLTKEWM